MGNSSEVTGMRYAVAFFLLIGTHSALNETAAADNLQPRSERTRKDGKVVVGATKNERAWLRKLIGDDRRKAMRPSQSFWTAPRSVMRTFPCVVIRPRMTRDDAKFIKRR